MPDATAKRCARPFVFTWVARFDATADISRNRGPQFREHLRDRLIQLLGVRLHRTCAYHSQANGLSESFHRHLKSALLMARVKDSNWVDALPHVLLEIRSIPIQNLKCSAAKLVYGTPFKVSGDVLFPSTSTLFSDSLFLPCLKEKIALYQPQQMSRHSKNTVSVSKSLSTSDFVFVRRDEY